MLVNAANAQLLSGSGVCGAFAKDAGEGIFDECDQLKKKLNVGSIPVGHTVMTTNGNIKQAKAILHTVGPKGSDKHRKELLVNAIENSLKMAAGIDVNKNYVSPNLPQGQKYTSIAIPALSTGIFGYPLEEAAQITSETINKFVQENPEALKEIHFIFLDPNKDPQKTAKAYIKAFDQQFPAVICAANAENQYSVKGEASCTHFALSFIALNEPATSEGLQKLLKENVILGNEFIAADKSFGYLNDRIERYKHNPVQITAEGLETFGTPLSEMDNDTFAVENNAAAMRHFLKFVLTRFKNQEMSGCVMSNGFVSVALRNFDGMVEFFDSHGPDETIENAKPAYVLSVPHTNEKETIEKLLPF
ncbi:MAG: macro domain-containing protein [Parachlamydiaceae bacterium]|nr:MAG: macro domain-containing protein [Parachlamydiaceae bacterium]